MTQHKNMTLNGASAKPVMVTPEMAAKSSVLMMARR
jgi:hypothetical protein